MWLGSFFQGCMDTAQSEQVSRPIRILCITFISLVSLIAITSLFLLVFVIEGQSLLRRGIFLIMEIIAIVHYLQFLKALIKKEGRSRHETRH